MDMLHVTMAMKVLDNSCNMCIRDLPNTWSPDMYAPSPQASGILIRQIMNANQSKFPF